MKKLFTPILIFGACAMAGCGQEKVEVRAEEMETVSFNTVIDGHVDNNTRAKEFGYWQPGETLDVTSYLTGTGTSGHIPFHLTYNGPYTTSWVYSPLVDVSKPPFSRTYYAYHPATANLANMTMDGENASFDYTVRDAAQHEDLIAAKTVTAYSRVPLMFHHLLSQVNFAVQAAQGVKMDIRNIRLFAIANSARYTFSPTGGSWTTPFGSAEYPYTPTAGSGLPTDGTNSDIIYLGNKGGGVPTDNDRTNALMVMPQSFVAAQGGYFTFEYTLTDMNNQPMKSGTAKVFLGDFTIKKWEPGKRYMYLLDLTGLIEEGPITFEVIMFGWTDGVQNDLGQNVAQGVVIAEGSKLLIEKSITVHNSKKATSYYNKFTIFPIFLANNPMAGGPNDMIYIGDFTYDNFVAGDQIRISCFSYSDANRIRLDPNNTAVNNAWTFVAPTEPGTDVILIKK